MPRKTCHWLGYLLVRLEDGLLLANIRPVLFAGGGEGSLGGRLALVLGARLGSSTLGSISLDSAASGTLRGGSAGSKQPRVGVDLISPY